METNQENTSSVGIADIELATNPEPRCAVTLLLDRSSSMRGQSIQELNEGVRALKTSLLQDPLACLRVEIAMIAFSSKVTVEADFRSPKDFDPPELHAGGFTSLGRAVLKGLELLETRAAHYRTAGLACYRPWMFLITDGNASDDTAEAARRVREAEGQRRLCFFGVAVASADLAKLAELSLRPPLRLQGLQFKDLFEWLSASLSAVAVSRPGDQVPLPPPSWSAA